MVEGYTSMGLSLSKHYLRAAMERDCQKIARNEIAKQVHSTCTHIVLFVAII